jgi:hypothetical protein
MKGLLLVVFLLIQYTETLQTVKRQGIFGLCQGWGAGCALNFRSPVAAEPRKHHISRPIPKSNPDVNFRPPSFFFTSGKYIYYMYYFGLSELIKTLLENK